VPRPIQQGLFQHSLEEAFIAYEFADSEDDRLPPRVAANLETMGRLAEAVAWYRLAVGKGYRPGDNEYALADCLAELTSDDAAAAMYRRFLSLFPELPQGWIGLCRLALLQRKDALAREICADHAPRYRDFLSAEEMEAQVAFFLRDFGEAERLYRDLLAKNPDGGGEFLGAITYQSALGRLRLESHDEQAGAALLGPQLEKETEILRSAPRHPGALYRMAAIAASLGDRDRAITNFRIANQEGWRDYRSAELDPRFDSIRDDPEFQQLIQTMKNEVELERQNVAAP
jgi:tetratricopeptide (TPR) repeat protein